MFKKLLLVIVFFGAIYMLYNQKKERKMEQQRLDRIKQEEVKKIDPLLPESLRSEYMLTFSRETISTLKMLTNDTNENVRFSAIELLWQLKDKDISKIIKNSFETETEPSMKIKILNMLAKEKSKLSLHLIAYALKNYDKDTRLRACEILGDFIDKETIDVLTPSLKDYDEDVRLKALDSINKIKNSIEQHREQKIKEIFEPRPIFNVQ